MSAFLTAFDAVLPLFLIILGGFLFSRTKMASEQWVEILNRFALWIGFPALVITLLSQLDLSAGQYNRMIVVNSVYFILCILLAFPYSRLFRFTNLRRRTLFLVIYVFWLLTLGLLLVETRGDTPFHPGKLALKLVTNPLLMSVIIGLFMAVTGLRLPGILSRSLSMLSQSVTPVVLFSLGIFMGFQKIGDIKEWGHVALFALVIMLILPGIFFLIASKTGWLEGLDLKASVLEAAMPVGLTSYALSQQYRLDTSFTARVVLLSTSLSLIFLPLWIVILG